MPYGRWLTPAELPTTNNCWQFQIPDSVEWEALFRGALLPLTRAYNWEPVGDVSPEACAAKWDELFASSFAMVPCEGVPEVIIGSIFWWPAYNLHERLLICDGAQYDVVDYPDLYAVLGIRYGGSTGSYFNVPDLIDRMIVGFGNTWELAETGGEAEHTLTVTELPEHSHSIVRSTGSGVSLYGLASIQTSGTVANTQTAGDDTPHNNMPPFMALRPVIVAL